MASFRLMLAERQEPRFLSDSGMLPMAFIRTSSLLHSSIIPQSMTGLQFFEGDRSLNFVTECREAMITLVPSALG
jgi:hypothetical protein